MRNLFVRGYCTPGGARGAGEVAPGTSGSDRTLGTYSGEGNNGNRDKRCGRWSPNSEMPRDVVPNRRKCREAYFPNAERDFECQGVTIMLNAKTECQCWRSMLNANLECQCSMSMPNANVEFQCRMLMLNVNVECQR